MQEKVVSMNILEECVFEPLEAIQRDLLIFSRRNDLTSEAREIVSILTRNMKYHLNVRFKFVV